MNALPALPRGLPPVDGARLPAAYEGAKVALAECTRIDECQDWANKAEALASYAKQAQDDELHQFATRIKARAIRRCGELLEQIKTASGLRTDLEPRDGSVPRLTRTQVADEAGLSERQRKNALRVARIPNREFEEAVEAGEPPTVTDLARRGTSSAPPSKEAQIRAVRERHAEGGVATAATSTQPQADPHPSPMPDLDELKSVLAMLRGDPGRIANLSLEKRVTLARACLAFLNLTVADLRDSAS